MSDGTILPARSYIDPGPHDNNLASVKLTPQTAPVQNASKANVADFGGPVAGQQYVLALDIEVDDAVRMQPVQPRCNVDCHLLAPAAWHSRHLKG